MGRKKLIANNEKCPAMTTYIPVGLKTQEQTVAKKYGVSLSARIRKIMEDDIKVNMGEVLPDFDFEDKKSERNRLKETEAKLFKMLESENLPNRKNAYDTMKAFAMFLGTDDKLVKNIDEVLVQIINYEIKDSDPFTASVRETFVQYLEAAVERRAIEAELEAHRRQEHEPLD
jgi:hypothetical protein